ncbi:MAG TPA: hypothetical protein VNO70_17545 [Blastocatellia bacterium]|nr:hypothetical protein [Blastocatellia bacterium]
MGMAFLFLSFAAIPVSLKAVGVNVELRPRAAAVFEAWREVAGVFAGGAPAVSEPDWAKSGGCESAEPANEEALTACHEEEQAEPFELFEAAPEVESQGAEAACPKATNQPKKSPRRAVMVARAPRVEAPDMVFAFRTQEIAAKALQAIPATLEIRTQVEKDVMNARVEWLKASRELRRFKAPKIDESVTVHAWSDCDFRKIAPKRPDRQLFRKTTRVKFQQSADFNAQDSGF